MNKNILPLMLLLCSLVFFTGCTSTLYNARYKQGNEDGSKKKLPNFSSSDSVRLAETRSLNENADGDDIDEAEPVTTRHYDLAATFSEATRNSANDLGANFTDAIDEMKMAIVKYDQTPYHYGGNDLDGIDCSGFTLNVYTQSFAVKLPRSAREQFQVGESIQNREELKFGDLVFFNTRRRVRPGHVGIYIGNNKFVHASSSNGVTISSLDEDYYNRKYMGARRVLQIEEARAGK